MHIHKHKGIQNITLQYYQANTFLTTSHTVEKKPLEWKVIQEVSTGKLDIHAFHRMADTSW